MNAEELLRVVDEALSRAGLVHRCQRMGDVVQCGVSIGRGRTATITIMGSERVIAEIPQGLSLLIENTVKTFEGIGRVLGIPAEWVEIGAGLTSADLGISAPLEPGKEAETIEKVVEALKRMRNSVIVAEARVTGVRKYTAPRLIGPRLPRIR